MSERQKIHRVETLDRPTPGTLVVRRDPCFKCGVRGDIGCKHQPAQPAMTLAEHRERM